MRKPDQTTTNTNNNSNNNNNNNNNSKLRKGLWSPEEDEKLMKYMVLSNGQGCWSDVAKNAGLLRCGKSCRLRWINYLRPDLKRGAFSLLEEELIVQLHSLLGNRWSQIAARLPGRTDNEIKNFWNSTIKKRLKADSSSSPAPSPNTSDSSTSMPKDQVISSTRGLMSIQEEESKISPTFMDYSSPPISTISMQTLAMNYINNPFNMCHNSYYHNPPPSYDSTQFEMVSENSYENHQIFEHGNNNVGISDGELFYPPLEAIKHEDIITNENFIVDTHDPNWNNNTNSAKFDYFGIMNCWEEEDQHDLIGAGEWDLEELMNDVSTFNPHLDFKVQ